MGLPCAGARGDRQARREVQLGGRIRTHRRRDVCALVGIALATALIAVLATPKTTTGAGSPDTYFHAKTSSSGTFAVDYQNDDDFRDGQYLFVWYWTTQYVVRFTEGRFASASALAGRIRFISREESNLTVRFSSDPPGTRHDDSNCPDSPYRVYSNPTRSGGNTVSQFARHDPAYWGAGADPAKPSVSIGGPPEPFKLAGCHAGPIHAPAREAMHGLVGFPRVRIEIPRGAFNPRSDRSYKKTVPSNVNLSFGDGHEGDGGFTDDAPHSVTGTSKVKIRFNDLSKKKAAEKARKYRDEPKLEYGQFG
jgi:hypothetical protein